MTTKRSLQDRMCGRASPARMLRNFPVGPRTVNLEAWHSLDIIDEAAAKDGAEIRAAIHTGSPVLSLGPTLGPTL